MITTKPTIHDIQQLATRIQMTVEYKDIAARIAPLANRRAIFEDAAAALLYRAAITTAEAA